jgi:hypothetical protein
VPSGYANLAVPLERLFLTCTKSDNNPWGAKCMYTGMYATNSYKCYTCVEDRVLNSAATACLNNEGGDPNCVRLNSERDMCLECWWPFWFHDRTCLKGGILKIVSLAQVVILVIFNIIW